MEEPKVHRSSRGYFILAVGVRKDVINNKRVNRLMADYYLINDQIKFYFDIEDQHIEYQGKQESLEPKESQILKYILENHVDGIIKSETILDNNWNYWSDKKVLQKVLSTLRRKLKLIGVTENGFISDGSDYKIKYRGTLVSDEEDIVKAKKANTSKILSKINSAAIWTFVGALSIFLLIESNDEINYTVDNIFQATALSGVSLFPALSPDGKAMVFAHRTDDDSKLYLKVESNLNYETLTEGHKDQMPAWSPNGRMIAYQRSEFLKSCEIRLIRLDENYKKIGEDEKLTDCNPKSFYSSITWRTDDEFYYSNKKGDNFHYDIMTYSLSQNKNTPYFEHKTTEQEKIVSGHYFLNYNQYDESLYTLSTLDYHSSLISKISKKGNSKVIHRIEDVLISIGIYKNSIIFKDVDNQLKAISISNPERISTIYQNPLKPISYPTVSSNSNKVLILSGSLYKDDIYAMNIEDGSTKQVLSSQYRLTRPQQINGQLYYISNKTGISQIYSYDQLGQHQITNFTRNYQIKYFTASNDNRWLAVNFLKETTLYKREPEGLIVVKTFPSMSNPAFSLDSRRLLLSTSNQTSENDGGRNLIEYDVNTMIETGIQIRNASFGKYHEKGIVYAQPEGNIKLFTLSGTEDIYEEEATTSPLFLTINKNYVFVRNGNTEDMVKININTKEQTTLLSNVIGQITSDDTNIFYRKKLLNNLSIFKGDLIKQ